MVTGWLGAGAGVLLWCCNLQPTSSLPSLPCLTLTHPHTPSFLLPPLSFLLPRRIIHPIHTSHPSPITAFLSLPFPFPLSLSLSFSFSLSHPTRITQSNQSALLFLFLSSSLRPSHTSPSPSPSPRRCTLIRIHFPFPFLAHCIRLHHLR